MSTIHVPVSIGELADKITILEIKADRIADPGKRANVLVELDGLQPLWQPLATANADLDLLKARLRAANERMWEVQDALRGREASQTFDEAFIGLARAVATHNGERVALKNRINVVAGSRFVEEKEYK